MAHKKNSNSGSSKKQKTLQIGKKTGTKNQTNKNGSREHSFEFESDTRPRLNSPHKEKAAQPLTEMRMGELLVERIAHDGRGIAYWQAPEDHKGAAQHHGKIVFIKQALPGEKIQARLLREHPRFIEARVDNLLNSSTDRCNATCVVFGDCGGCQLQHMKPELQIAYKQQSLLDQLGKALAPKKILPAILSPQFNYRRAARLAVDYSDGLKLGFREENSRRVVDVNACPVLTEKLSQLIPSIKFLLGSFQTLEAISHVELIDAEPKVVIIFRVLKELNSEIIEKFASFTSEQKVDVYLQINEGNELHNLAGHSVDPRVAYSLPAFNVNLRFHPRDFIQVNASVNQAMVNQAIDLLNLKATERVLDLFCGIGNFTLPLATLAKEVVGLEAVEAMVERGRENAATAGLTNLHYVASDLTKISENRLQQVCGKVDAILLDPPRDGAKEILTKITKLSAKRIVYVSCNPATLARDAKILKDAGFELDSLGVMDMFPQTAHLESMALFVKK